MTLRSRFLSPPLDGMIIGFYPSQMHIEGALFRVSPFSTHVENFDLFYPIASGVMCTPGAMVAPLGMTTMPSRTTQHS